MAEAAHDTGPDQGSGKRRGIAHPEVVDFVGIHSETGAVTLAIDATGDGAWDGSPAQLAQLQAKVNAYLAFALDGQLHLMYPETVGKAVLIHLFTTTEPDPATSQMLQALSTDLPRYGIEFDHRRL